MRLIRGRFFKIRGSFLQDNRRTKVWARATDEG